MIAAVTAHAAVLGIWAIAAIVLIGNGRLAQRMWGLRLDGWQGWSQAFWLGYGVAIAVLQLWHLALPVDARVLVVLSTLGLAGWIRGPVGSAAPRLDPRWALVGVIAIAWVANRALGPTALFDTGMYHHPSVAWSNAYPIVPGLGNLHGRLAFNSGALLFDALFDIGPMDGRALHVANGLLVSALLVESLCAWRAVRHGTAGVADVFTLAILPGVVHAVVRQDVRSLSTDAATAVLVLVTLRSLLDALARREREGFTAGTAAATTFLASTALVVKLSAAVFAGSIALVALLGAASELPAPGRWRALASLAPAGILVATWLVRGVILSGYPLYPATLFPFDVDWRVPLEQARAEAAWVTMSARNLNSNVIYPGATWLVPWVRGIVVRGDPFAQLTVPILLLLALLWRTGRAGWRVAWRLAWIPLGSGALFWMATAPHTRMAQGLAWGALGVAAVSWWHADPRRSRHLVTGAVAVSLALLLKQAAGAASRAPSGRVTAAVDALFTRATPEVVLLDTVPSPVTRPDTLADGLVIGVPTTDNSCWGVLACTPHPTPTLARRRPDLPVDASLRWGFRQAQDRWAPGRWPNPWTPFLAWWRCRRDGTRPCPAA